MDPFTAKWRKSSYSGPNAACVEIALLADGFGVRDSKDKDGPVLEFGGQEWAAFVRSARTDY